METFTLIILGLVISGLGILNRKGNISTIHSYHRKRVKEEDIPAYGKVVGTGTLIIGLSCLLSAVVSFWNKEIGEFLTLLFFIIGFGFILYGQFKYNKGLF